LHIYILTTQHFERELRKYLPVENRFCTMFEEALRRFPSNNFLEAVKKNFFWRWSQKTLSRLLFLSYVWFSLLDVSIYLHTPEVCCAAHAVRLGHHTDWRTDASIRTKVVPLIVRAEARFTPVLLRQISTKSADAESSSRVPYCSTHSIIIMPDPMRTNQQKSQKAAK
jgi:hypothetical protein